MAEEEKKTETHIVESKNQSGGITAHTITKNDNPQSPEGASSRSPMGKIIKIILVLAAVAGILTFLFTKPWRSNVGKNNNNKEEIHIVKSQNQSGGITAHTVNVNQQRAIARKVQSRKEKRGEDFSLQIILNQTQGVWNQGEIFEVQVKTSGPYKTAHFVRGMSSGLMNVRTIEDKENGFFSFSTTTAPLNNEVIILEILSVIEIDLVEINVTPLANKD